MTTTTSSVIPDFDPETGRFWRVLFRDRVCAPTFNSKGAAAAYLDMLEAGRREPEWARGIAA